MTKKSSRTGGKYVSIHLRFEEDMVAFSCCSYDGGKAEKIVMDSFREKWWKGKFKRKDRVIIPGVNRINGKCPLTPLEEYSSRLAALDYTVCLFSEVFVTTHGGNFPHFLMGHRRFLFDGHAKTIKPDKIKLVVLLQDMNIRLNECHLPLSHVNQRSNMRSILECAELSLWSQVPSKKDGPGSGPPYYLDPEAENAKAKAMH
ncbi:hypothetical protein Q3G72_003573 [Acer saccharum]|nr:hypothetical protein Q3G72_003573 [Acer saccharum]